MAEPNRQTNLLNETRAAARDLCTAFERCKALLDHHDAVGGADFFTAVDFWSKQDPEITEAEYLAIHTTIGNFAAMTGDWTNLYKGRS